MRTWEQRPTGELKPRDVCQELAGYKRKNLLPQEGWGKEMGSVV